MEKNANILILGKGLIGSHLWDSLRAAGYSNVSVPSHAELELLNQQAVNAYFENNRPEYVFFCAVKSITDFESRQVGDGDETYMNIMMQCNVIEAARKSGVKKMILLGSAMLYPWNLPGDAPMDESLLEQFNLPGYRPSMQAAVLGKLVGLKLCQYYNEQYGTKFIYCLPTHIYGGFAGRKSLYLLERLVMDICDAKAAGKQELFLDIFGQGLSKKQILHVDDCVEALVCVMNRFEPDDSAVVNVGSFQPSCWSEIVADIKALTHYDGTIRFNEERKENMANRICSTEKLKQLGWAPKISMRHGLELLCTEYQASKNGEGKE